MQFYYYLYIFDFLIMMIIYPFDIIICKTNRHFYMLKYMNKIGEYYYLNFFRIFNY